MANRLVGGMSNASRLPSEVQGRILSLSRNISESGVLCRTPKRMDEMTLLDIKFELPEPGNTVGIWVECRGIVVRCERKESTADDLPYEVDIFFDRMSERDRHLLADYVAAGK